MPVFGAYTHVMGVHVCIMCVFCFVRVYLVCMYVSSLLCAHVCPLFLHMLCDLAVYAYHVVLCHMCSPCVSVICFMCLCMQVLCAYMYTLCILSHFYILCACFLWCVHAFPLCTNICIICADMSYLALLLPSQHPCRPDARWASPLLFLRMALVFSTHLFPQQEEQSVSSHGTEGFMPSPGSCTCSFEQQPFWPHQDEVSCLPPSNPGVGTSIALTVYPVLYLQVLRAPW